MGGEIFVFFESFSSGKAVDKTGEVSVLPFWIWY